MSFTAFPLHERLQRAIATAGYQDPTPIQAAAIPAALAGRDILGTAQTGTGKTAAFALPLLHRLITSTRETRHTRALILTPTRELALQVHDAISQLGAHTNLRTATIFGGVGMAAQERALRGGVEILVACPGRLLDHADRGNLNFSQLSCLVLDEADRMLDMGFLPAVRRIIALLPRERQTMLFSATFAPELNNFVKQTLRDPERIDIGIAAPAETVDHVLYPVPHHLKTSLLLEMLRTTATDSVLIFTRTKHRANRVCEQLNRAGHQAGVLHANKSQNQREAALNAFRAGELRVLVATDIAARGIDVTSISHVINYDIPDCADAYIHRIGRTGRAERSGEAITFVTQEDNSILRDIERTLGARIATQHLASFDYTKPAPSHDEFHRDPQPSGRRPARGDRPTGPARQSAPTRQQAASARQSAPPAHQGAPAQRGNNERPPARTNARPQDRSRRSSGASSSRSY
jgi:ATP-dependent RNA helicase RhlE